MYIYICINIYIYIYIGGSDLSSVQWDTLKSLPANGMRIWSQVFQSVDISQEIQWSIWHHVIQDYIILYCITLYHVILYCIVSFSIILYHIALCCIRLYYIIFYYIIILHYMNTHSTIFDGICDMIC